MIAMFSAGSLHAALEWSDTTLHLSAEPQQSSLQTDVTFKNTGDKPITIADVTTSCGCVAASDIAGEYKPGDSGKLNIHYAIGTRVGTVIETVTVNTSEGDDTLRMIVDVPVIFDLEPENVMWSIGEPATTKEIHFVDLSGRGSKPKVVYSTSSEIQAELVKDEKGNGYTIKITPTTTDHAYAGAIYLDVDVGNGAIRKMRLFAAVQDPNERGKSGKTVIRMDE